MTDGRVRGFEDLWRPAGVRWIADHKVLGGSPVVVKARLRRIVNHTPEVVVSVTGHMHAARQVRDHLRYISRNGALELETPDGVMVAGRLEVRSLADDWTWAARVDSHRTPTTTIARSIVLSMPSGTDGERLEVAARAFIRKSFDGFDYAFVRHTDAPNPHVHLVIRSLGDNGRRFTPQKQHLDEYRQAFAQALRDQGVEAEATPRRARGVVLKAEHRTLRRVRENHLAGRGPMADVDVLQLIRAQRPELWDRPEPWHAALRERRHRTIATYIVAAEELERSQDPQDRALGVAIARFVRDMPQLLTRRELAAGRTPKSRTRAASYPTDLVRTSVEHLEHER